MQTKPAVYLETSFISYLAGEPSSDILTANRQLVSHTWWNRHRHHYNLCISPLVILECLAGDPAQAARRLSLLGSVTLFESRDLASLQSALLVPTGPIPLKAANDAIHIAYAAVYACEYLLTWNFRHLANAHIRRRVDNIVEVLGYEPPVICTPDELEAIAP